MKNLKFVLVAFVVLFSLESSAQVSINVNLGSRPDWCNNYDDEVEYVYLPEIECYYDVQSSVYIYFGGNGWIRSRYLPEYCHNYNPNPNYIVVLDYHGNAPFNYFENHRTAYFRDCHRNYRQEYYGHNYNRPNRYVVGNNGDYYYKNKNKNRKNHDDDYHDNGNRNNNYKRENRSTENRYVYQNNRENGNNTRNNQVNTANTGGNGRGNGRR